MARHRRRHRYAFSRARHRGPGAIERGIGRGGRAAIVNLTAVMLVISMFVSDPSFEGRN